MLPTWRASEIFPREVDTYLQHLGDHQSAAFSALWTIHDSDDPIGAGDSAAWHVGRALRGDGQLRVVPNEVYQELFDAAAATLDRPGRTMLDVCYGDYFLQLATFQHESLSETADAFLNYLYA